MRFYGLHVRLLLNSCSLQDLLNQCKEGVSPSNQALWLCYTSAVGMLELISQEFGPLKLLYFAQDSVHVMTAYAATFLIKVALSHTDNKPIANSEYNSCSSLHQVFYEQISKF